MLEKEQANIKGSEYLSEKMKNSATADAGGFEQLFQACSFAKGTRTDDG